MSGDTFTIEELVTALIQKPDAQANGAYTVQQLREAMPNKSSRAIRGALREHIQAGRMECISVPFERIDGVRTRVPAYRLVARNE